MLTAFTIACWGGVSVFLFMIIPIGFLLFWIINTNDKKSSLRDSGILFYVCWMIFTVLFSVVLGYNAMSIVNITTSKNGKFNRAGMPDYMIFDLNSKVGN